MANKSTDLTNWETAGGHYQRTPENFDGESPFLGEIQIFAGNYAPAGWAICNGALMSITSNTALFSLLGTNYGGDGTSTFGIPDLQGRVPVHLGSNGTNTYTLGNMGGTSGTALTIANLPDHNHTLSGTAALPAKGDNPALINSAPSAVAVPAIQGSAKYYSDTQLAGALMGPLSVNIVLGTSGSGAAVNNMQPYLALTYIICVSGGVFPSQT
jgi:microcystin-dependent protein